MLSRIRKNDKVVVLSGKDKGKEGSVLKIDSKKNAALIKGIAEVTKHSKPKKQGEQSGIIKKEMFVPLYRVMPICPTCKKGCRIRTKFVEGSKEKSRACHRCNGEF
ncbi:50S ribosomal protein L24 [Candidatus Babeliales bacterium]|nr:50S ribosomal protein L24 [Candidatus Babeliales bacterium]